MEDYGFVPGFSRKEFVKFTQNAASNPPKEAVPYINSMSSLIQCATPADYARIASRGRWSMAPHVALTNRYLMALASRQITRLIVTLPPRHGKSTLISQYLPGWWLGNFPNQKCVIASYGSDLATRWSGMCRNSYEEFGQKLFGFKLGPGRAADQWSLARPYEGGVKAAGVGGPLTGFGADLMVIDDYFKNNEEANSPVIREKVWEWWLSTASTRLEPNAVCVVMATRWHHDDLIGRLLKDMAGGGERWHILNLPAIAEENELQWPNGLGRKRGEALWPGRFNEAALQIIKTRLSERWWAALYQQRPSPKEGDMFKDAWLKIQLEYPALINAIRFWDLAATEDHGKNDPDFTASCKMCSGIDQRKYIFESTVDRGTPGYIEDFFIQKCREDGPGTLVYGEQEGGASGKYAMHGFTQRLIRENMQRWSFRGERPMGSKQNRAEPLSSAAEHDMIRIIPAAYGDWVPSKGIKRFKACLTSFPNGDHDDEVDAASGAFQKCEEKSVRHDVAYEEADNTFTDYVPR